MLVHFFPQVLLQYDRAPPMEFCARLLAVYDKLRQAKLELFGGHSQFAVALKEGFMRAFQCLDEIRAVRVSWRHGWVVFQNMTILSLSPSLPPTPSLPGV